MATDDPADALAHAAQLVITVAAGSSRALPWPWWLAGGLGMLAVALLGAWAVLRRTDRA